MERLLITGGKEYLPFARKLAKDMRRLGLPYMSKVLDVQDVRISICLTPNETFISIKGGADPLYQFFTTGQSARSDDPNSTIRTTPGYIVGAKYDRKTKQLVGVPLGSTLEADDANSSAPRWKFSSDPDSIGDFLPYKKFQVQGIPGHTFYPDAKPLSVIQNTWTSPTEIADASQDGGAAPARIGPVFFDRGYDFPVAKYTEPGKPRGDGWAPDADWYRRAAQARVESERWGARTYYLLTDTSNVLHVFQAVDLDPSLGVDTIYDWQQIKTNIPESAVVRKVIPQPAHAIQPLNISARDNLNLVLDFGDSGEFDYDPPLTSKRWEFNSTGTRMASVMISPAGELTNGEAKDDPALTGKPVAGDEPSFGLHEIEIKIKTTGEGVGDFEVTLTPLQEIGPESDRCIIGVGYYWGDVPDLHAPTGIEKDTLLVIELDVYQKTVPANQEPEPAPLEEMALATVKEFESDRVIDTFVTRHVSAPLGLRGELKAQSLVNLHKTAMVTQLTAYRDMLGFNGFPGEDPVLIPETTALYDELDELIDKFKDDADALLDGPEFTSTPLEQAKLEGFFQQCCTDLDAAVEATRYTQKVPFRKILIALKERATGWMSSSIPTLKTRNAMLAYDLRVLGFVIQRSYFHDDENDAVTRQDRTTVYMRGEVKHQTAELTSHFLALEATYEGMNSPPPEFTRVAPTLKLNPSKSLRAFSAIHGNGSVNDKAGADIPPSRADHNVDFPIGLVIYTGTATEFMVGGPFEILCVHPHGHWSVMTMPIVYCTAASKYFMPGIHNDGITLDAPPLDSFDHSVVDIVSVVVQGDDGPSEVTSTHLGLFNAAFDKTPAVKASDFHHTYGVQITDFGTGLFAQMVVQTPKYATPVKPRYAVKAVYQVVGVEAKEVIDSFPSAYIDTRVLTISAFSQRLPVRAGERLTTFFGRADFILPVGRGACMFTRRKEIKA